MEHYYGKLPKKINLGYAQIIDISYNSDNKTIATTALNSPAKFWRLDNSIADLITHFDGIAVSNTLQFLWEYSFGDRLNLIDHPHQTIDLAQMGYRIDWTENTCQYRPLLDIPAPNETKIDQVIHYLEERCAFKDNHLKAKTCTKPDPSEYSCEAMFKRYANQ